VPKLVKYSSTIEVDDSTKTVLMVAGVATVGVLGYILLSKLLPSAPTASAVSYAATDDATSPVPTPIGTSPLPVPPN
jgi:hypothetical protein